MVSDSYYLSLVAPLRLFVIQSKVLTISSQPSRLRSNTQNLRAGQARRTSEQTVMQGSDQTYTHNLRAEQALKPKTKIGMQNLRASQHTKPQSRQTCISLRRTDFHMPSGTEWPPKSRQIRNRLHETPIALLSGFTIEPSPRLTIEPNSYIPT